MTQQWAAAPGSIDYKYFSNSAASPFPPSLKFRILLPLIIPPQCILLNCYCLHGTCIWFQHITQQGSLNAFTLVLTAASVTYRSLDQNERFLRTFFSIKLRHGVFVLDKLAVIWNLLSLTEIFLTAEWLILLCMMTGQISTAKTTPGPRCQRFIWDRFK